MLADLDLALLATLSDDEIAHTLRMSVASFTAVAKTMAQNPHSTIEPAHRASADAVGRRALAGLGEARGERSIASGLDIERTIGEGGMGIVRLATQRSLGRKVAVKTLRPESRTEAATLRLLREAWVTGTLEHPNIVPVYDLGLDEDGSPIIILKRIEGVEWGKIMHDADAARERYGAGDLLGYNLGVLVQLCNAVSLAHARGVLHRDLKPENVMIGSFGGVYLVDWGIAVSLTADPLGRLPVAAEQNEMAGTPCYMAPEMLGAQGKLSARTDVYLLGAILHEILTGAPPHTGTFKQIIGSIVMSTFDYGGVGAPKELVEIARRAMAREPEARFASAEELRQRLEWYVAHRASLAISAEASLRLDDMRAIEASFAKRHAIEASFEPPQSVRNRFNHLSVDCRFGFRAARKASSDNEAARLGLREAIEIVVRFELELGKVDAAASALAELDDAPPELIASVDKARRAQTKEMARLELLDKQHDPATGRRTRVMVTAVLSVFWTVMPQVMGSIDARYHHRPDWFTYLWTGVIASVGGLVVLWGQQSLMKTVVNRRMVACGGVLFALQFTLEVGAHLLDLPREVGLILHLLVWGAAAAGLSLTVDRRFFIPTGAYLGAFLVACVFPARAWDLMSATNFVLLVTFLFAWWRPREDGLGFSRPPRAS